MPFNATVVSHWFQDAAGHHVNFDQLFQQAIVANRGNPLSPDQFNAYLAQHHYSEWVSYRPNGWFWHFQPSRPPATSCSPSCSPSPPCCCCDAARSEQPQTPVTRGADRVRANAPQLSIFAC